MINFSISLLPKLLGQFVIYHGIIVKGPKFETCLQLSSLPPIKKQS